MILTFRIQLRCHGRLGVAVIVHCESTSPPLFPHPFISYCVLFPLSTTSLPLLLVLCAFDDFTTLLCCFILTFIDRTDLTI